MIPMIKKVHSMLWVSFLMVTVAMMAAPGGGKKQGGDVRKGGELKVGSEAPDFTLKDLNGKEITLSSFRGKQPAFLIFGSYT